MDDSKGKADGETGQTEKKQQEEAVSGEAVRQETEQEESSQEQRAQAENEQEEAQAETVEGETAQGETEPEEVEPEGTEQKEGAQEETAQEEAFPEEASPGEEPDNAAFPASDLLDDAEDSEGEPVDDSAADYPRETGHRRPSFRIAAPWIGLSVILLAALVYVIIANPFADKTAVAEVNGEKITKNELYNTMVENGGSGYVQQLIMNKLIDQQVKKANIKITDKDVQDEIDRIKKQFPSEEQFNQALAQQGLTLDVLKEQAATQVKVNKLMEPQIQISEDDIKSYYDQNKDQLGTPEKLRLSRILLQSEDDANTVLQQLQGGADFAQVAKDQSQDAATKDKGGDMGFLASGEMDPAIEGEAVKLQQGEISGVFQAQDGYTIIKLTDHQAAVPAKYEDVKDNIRSTLFDNQVGQKFQTWYSDIESKAKIKNYLDVSPVAGS